MSILWRRIIIALIVGLAAGLLVYPWQAFPYSSELYPRLCAARALLSGIDPYKTCTVLYWGKPAAEYPLTTLLAFIPLSFLPDRIAASVFWALSNSLLAFAIQVRGKPHHWLIFISGAYWVTFAWQQFSLLFAAVMLLPELLPLTLLKPQIGLPVILTNLTRRRALACAAFVAFTFIVFPAWPLSWMERSRTYDGLIPLLTLPFGPLIALALRRWRQKDSLFLFLLACLPQRTVSDVTMLYMLPSTPRQMFILCLLSWVPGFLAWYGPGTIPVNAVQHTVLFVYLPLMLMQILPPSLTQMLTTDKSGATRAA